MTPADLIRDVRAALAAATPVIESGDCSAAGYMDEACPGCDMYLTAPAWLAELCERLERAEENIGLMDGAYRGTAGARDEYKARAKAAEAEVERLKMCLDDCGRRLAGAMARAALGEGGEP